MFTKKHAGPVIAICLLLMLLLLLFHNQIFVFMLLVFQKLGLIKSDALAAETQLQYRNGVIVSLSGIIFFYLIRSLEIHLLGKPLKDLHLLRFCYLALRMLRWAVVIVVGDVAMQYFYGTLIKISNYSMQYQAVGGLLAIELIILIGYLSKNENKFPADRRKRCK